MSRAATMAALASIWLTAACGGGLDTPAARTAQGFARAVAHDDPRAAYAMLSAKIRGKKSYAAFAREWKDTHAERSRQGAALGEAARSQVGERARLALPDGAVVRLTREERGWRLDKPLLPAPRARTPEEALRMLAQAVEDRNVAGVLGLLTSERREGVRQVLESFTAGLRAHASDAVEVTGDRATVVWSDGTRRWRVILKREQGGWRIDDFTQQ